MSSRPISAVRRIRPILPRPSWRGWGSATDTAAPNENYELSVPIRLIPIEEGQPGAGKLALVKGYLSLSPSEARENAVWAECIRASGWKGAIYQLRWESGHTHELIRSIGLSLLIRMGLKLAARRILLPLPPLGVYELSEIRRHWLNARRRAESADTASIVRVLADEAPAAEWTLLGHSLGARIVYNVLARHLHEHAPFRSAVLLGATVPHNDPLWATAANAVDNEILNVHHAGDRILNWLFRATELNRINPCGVRPVAVEHFRIRNIDASPWLTRSFRSHMRYHEVLHQTVGPHLWTTPAPRELPLIEPEQETPT